MILTELMIEHDLAFKTESALKSVDWNFDVDGLNGSRFSRGAKLLKEAETKIGELYKKSPEKAYELWAKYCPYAQPGSLPFGTMHD